MPCPVSAIVIAFALRPSITDLLDRVRSFEGRDIKMTVAERAERAAQWIVLLPPFEHLPDPEGNNAHAAAPIADPTRDRSASGAHDPSKHEAQSGGTSVSRSEPDPKTPLVPAFAESNDAGSQILSNWQLLESELNRVVSQVKPGSLAAKQGGPVRIVERLRQEGRVSPSVKEAVLRLASIRNDVVHKAELVSPVDAMIFSASVRTVVDQLRSEVPPPTGN